MNKKLISITTFYGLFCSVSLALADVSITDPLGICLGGGSCPSGWSVLLTRIAGGVGMLIASLGTIMIIWAGILYLTSAGSPEKMGKAKTAFIYAIIGIVVGILATTIANVIVGILQGT